MFNYYLVLKKKKKKRRLVKGCLLFIRKDDRLYLEGLTMVKQKMLTILQRHLCFLGFH